MNPHQEAVRMARYYHSACPVYLDTETTGLDSWAEIVEICILDHEGQVLLETLVKPGRPIPREATRINGITNEMVRSEPAWPEIWPQVEKILAGKLVGVYNADFDTRMLAQTHRSYEMQWRREAFSFFCLMKLYSQYKGVTRWFSLQDAGQQCRLSLPNAHRARADTLLARALLEYMAGGT